jgi:hypothetical protein
VQPQLVDQARRQVLVHRRRAAGDRDIGIARCRARLRQRRLDPVGDERERRPALHLERRPLVVGEHEHRRVVRRVVAPPAGPLLVVRPAVRAEHVAAHHERAGRRQRRDRVGVRVGLLDHPAVQPVVDALAERLIAALVGPAA